MTDEFDDLQRRARRLPPSDRAKLAEELFESLRTPVAEVEKAWTAEIERRVAALGQGETTTYAADEVMAEARRLLR